MRHIVTGNEYTLFRNWKCGFYSLTPSMEIMEMFVNNYFPDCKEWWYNMEGKEFIIIAPNK